MKRYVTVALRLLPAMALCLSLTACLDDGDETIALEKRTSLHGIPDDSEAGTSPTITGGTTTVIPNVQYTAEEEDGDIIVRLDMTGVRDPETLEWMRLFGTRQAGQNMWLEVDGKPKGFTVYNNADNETEENISTDLVFLVDNSGSMDQEADAVARDIVSWAQKLAAAHLDVRFGCVGYDVNGYINGGIDLTTATALAEFFNYGSGTTRTTHFAGEYASVLSTAAGNYRSTGDECGGKALRFADDNFHFRTRANRVYVNFTDEPNQPNGISAYSTEFFRDQTNWPSTKGTVHTVFSSDTTWVSRESMGYDERPWRISWYTGGTTFFTGPSFTGVDLESLPVTGAMQNSYVIRFTNVADLMDGQPHEVKIIILSEDGKTRAVRTFYIVFGYPEDYADEY